MRTRSGMVGASEAKTATNTETKKKQTMKTTIDLRNISLSHGTHRNEDLLPAFLFFLEEHDERTAQRFNSELVELGFGHSMCGASGLGNSDEWPDGFGDDEASELVHEMFDAIDRLAPSGYYFGAHQGDGSDFGFWPVELD
jgi:hypothetical protein